MRVLLAIKGCHRDSQSGVHQASRDTWLSAIPYARVPFSVDYSFFVGQGGGLFPAVGLRSDEKMLYCPDDYNSLPLKTKAILEWALPAGYDFIYLCDTDTLVMVERLLRSGFQKYDYLGGFNGRPGDRSGVGGVMYPWASGGPGYWLSAKAAAIVAASQPNDWAEDRWVGQVLGPEVESRRISAHHDLRYYWGRNGAHEVIDICLHYSSEGSHRPFDPKWMYTWWRELNQ